MTSSRFQASGAATRGSTPRMAVGLAPPSPLHTPTPKVPPTNANRSFIGGAIAWLLFCGCARDDRHGMTTHRILRRRRGLVGRQRGNRDGDDLPKVPVRRAGVEGGVGLQVGSGGRRRRRRRWGRHWAGARLTLLLRLESRLPLESPAIWTRASARSRSSFITWLRRCSRGVGSLYRAPFPSSSVGLREVTGQISVTTSVAHHSRALLGHDVAGFIHERPPAAAERHFRVRPSAAPLQQQCRPVHLT